MVEVVVGPVRREHRLVLAVEQVVQLHDVTEPLRLLDRLGPVEELLDVAARPLLEQRHLTAPPDVLLVEAGGDQPHPTPTRPQGSGTPPGGPPRPPRPAQ